MRIERALIEKALDVASELRDQYRGLVLNPDHPSKSLDLTRWVIRQYVEKPIEIQTVQLLAEGRSIWGACIAFDDHYEIYVLQGLEPTMHRFVQFKELFHVALDVEDARRLDISDHIEELLFCFRTDESDPNDAVVSEQLAEMAAMEYLLPYSERRAAIEAQTEPAALAARHGIPERFVEMYMSDHAMEFFAPFFDV